MTLVSQRKRPLHEPFGRFATDRHQLLAGKLLQRGTSFVYPREIFPNDPGVDLADSSQGFPGATIPNLNVIEAGVRLAASQDWQMWQMRRHLNAQYTPSTMFFSIAPNGLTSPTPSQA